MMEKLTEEFSIADVITEELIDMQLTAATKEEAIEELTALLYKKGIVTAADAFAADVFQREQEGMTGLGQGVAIPHGKSDSVVQTSLVVGKTASPIPWESLDGEPVSVVILFAVKNTEANTTHIKLLQKVAMLLADEAFIDALHQASTKADMLQLLSQEPAE